MNHTLRRIKRAVKLGGIEFTEKADLEMVRDSLNRLDLEESIFQATATAKTMRSLNPRPDSESIFR